MSTAEFVKGLELSGLFFEEAVRPALSTDQFSDGTDLLQYSAWRAAPRKLYE